MNRKSGNRGCLCLQEKVGFGVITGAFIRGSRVAFEMSSPTIATTETKIKDAMHTNTHSATTTS